jgi:diguanylate cyclase (GGDEF)-like protein
VVEQNDSTSSDQHSLILSHLARRDFWLRLPAPFEADFCRDHDRRAVEGFNSMIGSVALLYFGLGGALILVSGMGGLGFWPASYAVFMVLIVAAWLFSVADLLSRNYQLLISVLVALAVGFALVHPSLVYGSDLYYLVHEGTIFIMVIVFLGLNLRLPWALAATAIGGAVAVVVVLLFELPVGWGLSASTFLGGSLLGMVLRYRDERHLRREHLHARLLLLDNERIQALANQLERLSFLDGLTGLANRRYFDSGLDKAWRSCQRDNAPLTVIMVDVDFFKPYNDFYGHQQGDQALRDLAQTISAQAVRPQDMVARYGGEEFVVLLPWVDEEAAGRMAEKILQAVRQRNLPHERSTCAPYITVSAGVATRVPTPEMHPSSLVAAADEALYRAKHDGRDRWRQASQ